MYKLNFEYEHKIGDIVYHRASGAKGIVLDIIFRAHTNLLEYCVTFGHYDNESVDCVGVELSKDKVII